MVVMKPIQFHYHCFVIKKQKTLGDHAANLFLCDGAYGLDPGGAEKVSVSWESNSEVLVRYPAAAKVFSARESIKGLTVRYLAVEPISARVRGEPGPVQAITSVCIGSRQGGRRWLKVETTCGAV